jgi:diguanylate cyclase (GGDEF)-like protein
VWGRFSLKFKLTSLVIFVVALSSYMMGKFMYNGITNLLDKTLGLRAETVAVALVDSYEPAWLDSQAVAEADDKYTQFLRLTTRLVRDGYISRIDIIRFQDVGHVVHMLSLPVDKTPEYYTIGQVDQVEPGQLYAQTAAGHHGIVLSAGVSMAGWVPILRGTEPVGLVVVVIDGKDSQSALDTAGLAIWIVMVSLILSTGLVAYKFSATFEKSAVTDGLMGIYNHKFFKQRLEQEVSKSHRYSQLTSLVLIDIDLFKRVNDTYGHATGDIVLKNLAKIVVETSRTTDVVARYGGEEIAVILTHTGIAGAQEFAERLRLKVSHFVHSDPGEKAEFRVTISLGVAQVEPGLTMIDVIKRADSALYRSKGSGRNRVTIYQEEILVHPPDSNTKGTR